MSEVKERILGAVTIMSEEDAQKVWDLIRATFSLSNLEETIPDDEETAILKAYHAGSDEYQPVISHKDLLKELGI